MLPIRTSKYPDFPSISQQLIKGNLIIKSSDRINKYKSNKKMSTQHQVQRSLAQKFEKTISTNFTATGIPVSAHLAFDLQRQSDRIFSMIQRKAQSQENVAEMAEQHMRYRSNLNSQIRSGQDTHAKHRSQFLAKRMKVEKLKMEYATEINMKFKQMEKDKKKSFRVGAQKHRQEMLTYWDAKKETGLKTMRSQSAAKPLHSDAVHRKLKFDAENQSYALRVKGILLQRHSPIKQNIENMINKKQREVHDVHTNQIKENLKVHEQILEGRQNRYVNSIGFHRSRSEGLLKRTQHQYNKKMEMKHLLGHDVNERIKSAFIERRKQKVTKAKDCKCWTRGLDQAQTRSLVANEEELHGMEIKEQTYMTKQTSLLASRRGFMQRSQTNLGNVVNKQRYITENRLHRSEKKLIKEKEISMAIRVRKQIQNQANCLIRKSNFMPAS